jgi:hypothetical protein
MKIYIVATLGGSISGMVLRDGIIMAEDVMPMTPNAKLAAMLITAVHECMHYVLRKIHGSYIFNSFRYKMDGGKIRRFGDSDDGPIFALERKLFGG